MKNVMVTGACGYVGSVLCDQLQASGYNIKRYDTGWFGGRPDYKDDIRNHKWFKHVCRKNEIDTVIHLACISNDTSFALDEELSTSINLNAFEPLVIAAKEAGVKRFINASTSSVYGVSEAKEVTEDHPLVPLTLYNKYKGMCEPLLFKHQDDDFTCVTIRPATLCGVAPRQRLDLTVNILTNDAVINNEIVVFGVEQKRPNLHIKDMCNLYELLLRIDKEDIAGKTFNCAYNNMTIREIANTVREVVYNEFPEKEHINIKYEPTEDERSYHINSDKIRHELGFFPQWSVETAVYDLCDAFKAGKFKNSMTDNKYYNVRKLKELEVK